MNVDLLPCCKPRLLEQENWGTVRKSVDVLPAAIPQFPTARRMTLGMNSSIVVLSLDARAAVEQQQRVFTDSWDPLFIGYSAAVYFHTCEIKRKLVDYASKEDARIDASGVLESVSSEDALEGRIREQIAHL